MSDDAMRAEFTIVYRPALKKFLAEWASYLADPHGDIECEVMEKGLRAAFDAGIAFAIKQEITTDMRDYLRRRWQERCVRVGKFQAEQAESSRRAVDEE